MGLYFYKDGEMPKLMMRENTIVQSFIKIPPGAETHQEVSYLDFPHEALLYSAVVHAHYRGTYSDLKIRYPDGTSYSLLKKHLPDDPYDLLLNGGHDQHGIVGLLGPGIQRQALEDAQIADIAATLGISPMPLVVAVMLAASTDFSTPIGYQTNTFIYGPGGYRFSDYARLGAPLTGLILLAAPSLIALVWPFVER